MPTKTITPNDIFYFEIPFRKLENFSLSAFKRLVKMFKPGSKKGFHSSGTTRYHYQVINIKIVDNSIRIYCSYYPIRVHYNPDVKGTPLAPHADPFPDNEIPNVTKRVLTDDLKDQLRKQSVSSGLKSNSGAQIKISGIKAIKSKPNDAKAKKFVRHMQNVSGFWI